MKLNSKTWTTVFILALAALAVFFILPKQSTEEVVLDQKQENGQPSETSTDNSPQKNTVIPEKVLLNVPFTSQAPLGEWSDPEQQDGCEEASLLMAWHWLQDTKFDSPQDALSEIKQMNVFENEQYGNPLDTSAVDTMRTFKDYFNYDNIFLKNDPTAEDIIAELAKGHLVIAPFDGQKLGNPNYTGTGPERHMLVVRGYDNAKKQFITNDPGTRRGEGYRYSYTTLINAIRDYPTGHKVPIEGIKKVMLVVEK